MAEEEQSCLLTTLPIDAIEPENNEFLKKCGIIISHRNTQYVNATFPQGWWTKHKYGNCFEYFDQNNYPKFLCERNHKYSYISIFSQDQSISLYNEYEQLKNEKTAIDTAINTLFVQKWSPINKYIVYYYISGKHSADSFMSGYRHDKEYDDCVVEFSDHKFIGFVDNIDKYEMFVEIVQKNKQGTGYDFSHYLPPTIVIRETDEKFTNLHRFEIKHMFKYDPYLDDHDKKTYIGPHEVGATNYINSIIKETMICD